MGFFLKLRNVNRILISLFVFLCVLLPGDIFSSKKILFSIICLLNYRVFLSSLTKKSGVFFLIFGFIFPSILFFYSSFLREEILTSFSRSFAPYTFLLIIIIRHYAINFEDILIKAIYFIMITTILFVLLDMIGFLNVNSGFVREIIYGYNLGLMGKSLDYPFYYKVFFKTSPLLVVLLFKKFHNSQYFTVSLTLLALIFSGTRANVIFSVFFLFVYYSFYDNNKHKFIKYIFLSATTIFLILFFTTLLDVLTELVIEKGRVSDVIRAGHIEGIKELLKNDPWIIFKGTGMGSVFFSYGADSYVSSIEWSYIDLWRQMGLPLFSLFIFFISLPIFIKTANKKFKKAAYITYLCIAATNPLLFSSTSYLMFIYMYYDLNIRFKAKMGTPE